MCDGLNVEWANAQLNSPLFHENPASHTFFIRDFSEPHHFFWKYTSKKSPIAAKANKCKM